MNDSDLQLASVLFNEGKKKEASNILKKYIQTNPSNPAAWYALAFCLDDRDQKIYCLENVMKLSPDNRPARLMLQTLSQVTDPDLEPALKNQAGQPESRVNMASQLISEGKDVEAEILLDVFVNKTDPNNEEAWLLLAKIARSPSRKIYCLKRVIKINSQNQTAISQLQELGGFLEPEPREEFSVVSGEAENEFPLKRIESGSDQRWSGIIRKLLKIMLIILAVLVVLIFVLVFLNIFGV
jgi:predicted Zn-dependent protease